MQEVSLKACSGFLQMRGASQETDGKNHVRAYEMSESHKAPKLKTHKLILAEALNAGVWVK